MKDARKRVACDACGNEVEEVHSCPFCGRDVCDECAEWGRNGRSVVGCAACALDAETEN